VTQSNIGTLAATTTNETPFAKGLRSTPAVRRPSRVPAQQVWRDGWLLKLVKRKSPAHPASASRCISRLGPGGFVHAHAGQRLSGLLDPSMSRLCTTLHPRALREDRVLSEIHAPAATSAASVTCSGPAVEGVTRYLRTV
jgi:hypothetical protein